MYYNFFYQQGRLKEENYFKTIIQRIISLKIFLFHFSLGVNGYLFLTKTTKGLLPTSSFVTRPCIIHIFLPCLQTALCNE